MVIDPLCIKHGAANVADYENPIKAIQAAYNAAAQQVTDEGRTPVRIEVYIFVEKKDA